MIKAAKSDNEESASNACNTYQFNINQGLCKMLLDGLLKSRQVTADDAYVFDYDNLFIPTEKSDAKFSYKKTFGYFPGTAQIEE